MSEEWEWTRVCKVCRAELGAKESFKEHLLSHLPQEFFEIAWKAKW